MTSTETYTAVAGQARQATEKSVEAWKQGARAIAGQANTAASLPTVNLIQPVERYFEYLQMSIDLNRSLATRWAELVTSMSGAVRDQAAKASTMIVEQTDTVGDLATDQAKQADELAHEQADEAEKFEKEQARLARQAERAQARAAHAQARERYEDLTKAELSDQLAERGLPKSGTVDELIERLVSADSE